jgi:thioesterase domain-containing protein
MFLVLDTRWRRGLGSKWRAEVAKHELAFLRHRVRQAYGANAPTGGYEALRQSDWIQRVTRRYRPPPTGQKVVLLRCASTVRDTGDPALGWGALVGDNIELRDIPGTHGDMLTRPNVDVVAGIVAEVVRTSEGPS